MRKIITVTGYHPRPDVVWPANWPIPPIGAQLMIPRGEAMTGMSGPLSDDEQTLTVYVRHVSWVPMGNPEEEDDEPYVYISLGPRLAG